MAFLKRLFLFGFGLTALMAAAIALIHAWEKYDPESWKNFMIAREAEGCKLMSDRLIIELPSQKRWRESHFTCPDGARIYINGAQR